MGGPERRAWVGNLSEGRKLHWAQRRGVRIELYSPQSLVLRWRCRSLQGQMNLNGVKMYGLPNRWKGAARSQLRD